MLDQLANSPGIDQALTDQVARVRLARALIDATIDTPAPRDKVQHYQHQNRHHYFHTGCLLPAKKRSRNANATTIYSAEGPTFIPLPRVCARPELAAPRCIRRG